MEKILSITLLKSRKPHSVEVLLNESENIRDLESKDIPFEVIEQVLLGKVQDPRVKGIVIALGENLNYRKRVVKLLEDIKDHFSGHMKVQVEDKDEYLY